jgi:hypothetical protein
MNEYRFFTETIFIATVILISGIVRPIVSFTIYFTSFVEYILHLQMTVSSAIGIYTTGIFELSLKICSFMFVAFVLTYIGTRMIMGKDLFCLGSIVILATYLLCHIDCIIHKLRQIPLEKPRILRSGILPPIYNFIMPTIVTDSPFDCPICIESFSLDKGGLIVRCCGKSFHEKCISHWILMNPVCPMCRASFRGIQSRQE